MAKKIIQMKDKYKSTTNLYPKVTMGSLSPAVKEYIEGQGVQIDDNVVSQTKVWSSKKTQGALDKGIYLTGTIPNTDTYVFVMSDLSNLNYEINPKVGDLILVYEGFLPDTKITKIYEIISISGVNLTSAIVGSFSAGGGNLYQHNINATDITSSNPIEVSFTIINDSNEVLTYHKIAQFLKNNGFTTRINHISASGIHYNSNQQARYLVYGVFSANGTDIQSTEVKVGSAGNSNDYSLSFSNTTINDTIIAL